MTKRKKIKVYIQNTFIKYAVVMILIILGVFLLSLYVIFTHSIVKPSEQTVERLAARVTEGFNVYRTGLEQLAVDEQIIQALQNGQATTDVNRMLYDFRNEQDISSNFVLLNRDNEILSSSLYQEAKVKLENSFFIDDLTSRLRDVGYQEQSVGNQWFDHASRSAYYFSRAIEQDGSTLGYLVFFIDDFVTGSNYNQMIYMTDRYHNVIASTHDFNIDRLGKFSFDQQQHIVSIGGHYFYQDSRQSDNQNIWVLTVTPIQVYRSLLIYGILSMSLSSLVIILSVLIATPNILQKTLQPFDTLVSFISNQNHAKTVQEQDTDIFDELHIIYEEYNSKIQEIKKLIDMNKQITEKKRVLEIKHLEAKFNPHFLYNVLEMIKYEISLDPDNASEMIVKISNLLRYNTNFGNTTVPLSIDLQYLQDYISLQKMRFGSRLCTSIDISTELLQVPIPKLIIQPLIENAIKHNIDKVSQLSPNLEARCVDQHLIFKVEDDGYGIGQEQLTDLRRVLSGENELTEHNGLKNTHSILQLLYGTQYGLEIDSRIGQGTLVRFRIPVKEVG